MASILGNVEYVAQFEESAAKYTLTWNFDGGVVSGEYTKGEVSSGTDIAYPTVTKTGYNFVWNPADVVKMPANDLLLSAVWSPIKYVLTLKNATASPAASGYDYGTEVTLTAATPVNSHFVKWNDGVTTESRKVTVTANATYEAEFEVDTRKLTVTYSVPAGVDAPVTVVKFLKKGDNYSVVSPVIEGYTADPAAVSGTMGSENVSVVVNYAINKFTVTYRINGAYNTNPEFAKFENVAYGSAIPKAPAVPEYEGFFFSGWSGLPVTMPNSDITVTGSYVNREPTSYKITFKNGNDVLQERNVIKGAKPSYTGTPEKAATAKYIYTFKGWNPEITEATAPAVYVAVFDSSIINYTISLTDAEVTSASSAAVEGKYAYGTKLILTPTVSAGSHFTQWSDGNTENPRVVTVAANASYTAESAVNSHVLTITYKAPAGVSAPAKVVKTLSYNADYDVASPAVEGYTADVASVSGKMPDADVNKVVTYAPKRFAVELVGAMATPAAGEDGKYAYGTKLTLTPVVPANAHFTQWSDGNTSNPRVVTVNGDASYSAESAGDTYVLTITYKTPAGVTAPAKVVKSYNVGEEYSIASPEVTGHTADRLTVSGPMAGSDVNETVNYEANTYTITLDANGGDPLENVEAKYGAAVSVPQASRSGYTFAGWVPAVPATMPAENITLTASWTINKSTITFNTNGGNIIQPVTLDVGATISAPVAPSKKGFVFAGWYSDESLEKAYAFGTMPVENITVYAKWEGAERTISLNLNGGELNVDAISGAYGSAVVAPADPTKTGFTFAGWFADAQFTKAYTFTTIPMEDIIVYAKWDINDYTIAFNSNGGSAVASITQPFNSTVKAPAEPKKSGYKFDGWYSDESLEKAYAFGTMPAENITVYAKWSVDQFEIAFESNGGSAVETIRQDYNSDVTKPVDPTKVGHTFAGWFADESLENAYTFGKMPAKNITVYAKWNVNQYTIDFDSDGGSAVASIKQDFGSAVVAPAAPTKVGYTFAAWVPALPETMPAENTSVKATWNVNIYIITYDLDGGVGTVESKHAFESDVTAPENPTKTGYVFEGWYTEKALVNKYTFGKMPAKPFKLYAKWIPQTSTKYVVTRYFQNVDNDEYTQDKSKDEAYYGPTGSMTVVEPAEFAGYEGFSLNESKSRAIAISADGSTVVNAYYDRNEYSVFFKSEGKTFLTSHFRYGAKPEFPANHQKPEKKPDETSEYTFAGWNPLLPATMPANDITVDAVFDDGTKVKYQLVWDFDGGVAAGTAGVNYTAGQVTNGDAITYPEKVTMEGHHLTSWDPADVTVMPKGNLKLKAVWTPNDYTITLKGATIEKSGVLQSPVSCTGEGKAKVCKYVFSYGTQLSLIADIPPEDDEHFVSWADGTEDKPIYDNPRKVIVKGDASYETVYETMTDKNFHKLTITYVAPAGVVVPMEKVNQYVKNGLTYSVESPEIEGYTADKSTVSGTMGDQDVSVTVTYSVNKHKVIYKVTGDYFTEKVYEFEREFDAILRGDAELNSITSSKMEEEGYTFHGWNSLRPYKMPDEDVVITGYYTKNSYKLQIVYVLKDGPLRTQYTTSGSYVGHKVMEERDVPFGDSYSYAVASTFTDTKGVAYSVTASDITTSDYTADKMNVSGSMPAHDVRVDITLTANKSNILAYIEYGSDASKNKSYSVNDIPNVFKGKDATDKVDSALRYRHIYPPRATDPIEDDSVYVFNGWEINGDRSVVTPTFKKIKKVTKEIEVTYLDKNGNPVTVTIEVYDGISADHVGQMISDWIKEKDPANAPASYSDDYYWHEYRGWVESPKGSGKYVVNYTHHPREITVKVVYDEDSRPEKTANVIIRMVDLEPEHALVESHARDPIAVITAYMKANGYAPTKERDAQYYYSFVVGTNTYSRPEKVGDDYISRPDWTKTLRQYPITFKNGKTALKTISVDYGTVPVYDGETPVKDQTTEFEYTFSGWEPALEKVTGTFEYTAKFDQNLRKYKLNYEGATASPAAEGDLYEYGTEVTLTASPEEFHHFTSWTDGVTQSERKVTVDEKGVTYVATNEPNKYVLTVVYANPSEGKRTSHEVLAFGEKVHYVTQKIDGYTPVPESFDLTMPGNDTTVNVTYTAENYTITLVNATLDDDSEAKKISKECNAETNTCNYVYGYGTTLKLIPNEKEHYSFAKWVDGVTDNPRIVIVTGDASYEPEYVINTHKLTITYTITYTTTSGAEAPKAYEATLNYNDEFSVTSPELEGYTPERSVVSGTLTADAEYTVAYKPNNYTLTIHYVKKNGEAAAADYVNSEVPYLSEFSVTSPINERFVSDSAVVKGVMNSVDGLEITIPYTGKPYTVYAKYIPKYGSEDTEEQKVIVTYDYSHSEIEHAINEALESNDPVIVPQKTYTLTEKFTFDKTWTLADDGKYEPNFAASPREAKEVVAFVNESDYTVSIPNDGKVTAAEVTAALNKFFADKSIVPLKASTLVTDYTFNKTWTLGDDDKYVPNFDESDRLQISVTAVVNGQDYSGISVPADAKTPEIYEAINNYFAGLKVVPVQASTLTTDYTFNETWTKGDDGKYAPNFNESPRKQKIITVVVNNMNKSASVPANGSHAEIDEAICVDIYDKQEIRPVQTSSLTHDYTFVDRTNAAIDHWKEFDDNIYIPLFDSTARAQKNVVAVANGNEYRDISVPNDGKQTAAEISAAINVHFADHGIAKPKQASTLTVDYAFTDTWQKNGTSGGLDRYIPIFNESARPQTTVQVQFANAVQKVTEPADVNVPTDGTVPEIYEAIRVAFPKPTHEDRDSTYAFKCWTPEADNDCSTKETLPGKLADKKTPFVANLKGSVKKTTVIVAYEKVDTTYFAGDKTVEVEIDVPDLKDPSKVFAKVNSADVSEPTKTGYTFKAWDAYSYIPVAAADFESAYNAMPVSGTKATNIVYLAGWTINQYTVTFSGNGGTIDGKTTVSFTQDYKSVVTAPATQPTRANYSFDGWLDMPATVPAEDVTVKAKWKQNLIKVVFDPANPVYTGSAQVPTITVSSAEGNVDPENYIVSWDKDGFVDAGDYKVTVKGKENTDYTDTVSFTATYTISRAPIEIALSATKGTYTGLEHEKPALTVKSSVGAKPDITEDKDAYTASWDDVSFKNAKTYTITVTGKGNYTGTAENTYVIDRAPVKVTAVANTKVYGVKDPAFKATVTGLVNGESEDLISYTLPRDVGENAGIYKIKPTGDKDQGNYTITYVPADFTITQNTNSLEVAMEGWVYSGKADKNPVPTFKQPEDGINVKFYAEGEPTYLYKKVGSEDWSSTIPVDAGTYTVKASIAETANYKAAEAETNFTITKFTENKVTVTLANWDYDGTAHTPSTEVQFHGEGEPVIKYAVKKAEGEYVDADWFDEAPVNQGTYLVKASVEDTDNYNETADTTEYTINRADVATYATISEMPSIYYDGDKHTPTVTVKRGENSLVLDGDYTVAWDKSGFTDADTYTVTITGIGNYIGEKTATYVIMRAPIEIVLSDSVTYNGIQQIPNVTLNNKVHKEELASGAATDVTSKTGEYDVAWSYNGDEFSLDDEDIFKNAGVYTISVTGKGNYAGAEVTANFPIGHAPVTVVADAEQTKEYGENDPETYKATVDGLVNQEPSSKISYTIGRVSGEDAGTYTITPAGDAIQGNYSVSYETADFTITRAPVTVAAVNENKTYGEADPELTVDITGMKKGESAAEKIRYEIGRNAGESVGDYVITPTGDAVQGNYSVSYTTEVLTISKATENSVTVTMDGWKYGEPAKSPVTTVKESFDPKHVKFHAEGEPTITYAKKGSSDWSEDKPIAAGTYLVKASIAETNDYVGAISDEVEFTIEAAPIEIVMVEEVAYNGKVQIPDFYVISGVTKDELTLDEDYTVSWNMKGQTNFKNVADYVLTINGINNYSGKIVKTYKIAKADPKLTIAMEGWTYGETANEPVVEQSSWIVGEPVVSYAAKKESYEDGDWSSDMPEYAGDYVVKASVAATDNYNAASVLADFTIKRAAVTVVADAGQTKVYGQPDPATYTATVNGMVKGESISLIKYSVAREPGENVGEYTVTPSGDASQGNYSVSYETAEFTITPAKTPVIVLSLENTIYNGAEQKPTLTLTFGEGESAEVLVEDKDYSVDWGSANWTDAGTYTVTVNGKGNFDGTQSATFKITQKEVTVVANADQTKIYGEVDPKLTATINGVVEGEDAATLIEYDISRTEGEDVGEYTITPSGAASQGNYSVTYTNGMFAITQASVEVAAVAKTKVYGDDDPSLTVDITGLKRGDAENNIKFIISRAEGEDVDSYTITVSGDASQNNYSVTYKNATFTITQKAVTVVADAGQRKVYGESDPTLKATINGVVEGEVATDKISYSITRAEGENVGEYTVTPSGDASQGNYSVTYVTDKFTITPAETPVIVLSATGATYNGSVQKPGITLTFGEGESAEVLVENKDYTIDWGSFDWKSAGTHTVKVTGLGNFAGEKSATFEITQKAVTVVADANQTKIYGDADPKLTATINGVVEGEDAATLIKYDISRAKGENVGDYTITLSGEKDQGNYSVTYTNGTFAITQAEIPEIVLSTEFATYNGAEQKPTLMLTFGEGEKARTLVAETDYTVDWGSAIWTDAGTYTVTVNGKGNFTGTQTADFKIGQKSVIITIDGASKMYGVDDPAFTGTVTGLVNDSDLGDVSFIRSNNTTQDVGLYTGVLDVVYTANDNYDVKVTKGDFEITKRPITFTSGTSRKFYDGEPIVDGNVVLSVNEYAYEEKFNCSTTGSRTEVGIGGNTFACTPGAESGAKLDNYEVTYVIGTLTIDPVVSFAMNDHGSAMEDAKVLLGEKLPKPVDPTDVNYNFLGWFTDNETFKNAYDFDEAVNENKTLFAQWTVKLKTLLVKLSETEGDTIQVVVPVINTLDENIAAVDDAFFNHDPELPLPTKAMDEDSTYAFDGWSMVEEDVFAPKFKGIFRPDVEIKVLVNEGVVPVITRPDDKHDVICKKIDDELEKLGIVVRVPDPTDTTVYIHVDWMQNQETKFYEPVFKEIYRTYTITYVMPDAELSEKVYSYTYGSGVKLPQSTIKKNEDWIFKGWYTRPNGLGKHVKAVAADEIGDKTYYAFFQISVGYKVNDVIGEIEIAYTDDLDKMVEKALAGFVPEESGKMVFDKWVKSDTYFYEATFKEKSGGSTALASRLTSNFQVFAGRRSLTITGAKVGSKVQVIDGKGRVVYSGVIAHVDQAIEVKNAGSYMVRVNNQVVRVNIK